MSSILLIVDMQESFHASRNQRLQQACAREIKKAIRDKAYIVFVEYEHHGPTLPILTNIVKQVKYRKVHSVLKAGDDGSYEIKEYLTAKHMPKLSLRVCGVNTNFCVRSTVVGLREIMPKSEIQIIGDACYCHSRTSHTNALRYLKSLHNIKILRAPSLHK